MHACMQAATQTQALLLREFSSSQLRSDLDHERKFFLKTLDPGSKDESSGGIRPVSCS